MKLLSIFSFVCWKKNEAAGSLTGTGNEMIVCSHSCAGKDEVAGFRTGTRKERLCHAIHKNSQINKKCMKYLPISPS